MHPKPNTEIEQIRAMNRTAASGWLRFLLWMSLWLLLPVTALPAADRVALVIGNGNYANAPLRNPVNDATDVAAALKGLRFQVIRVVNADLRGMKRALRAFRRPASPPSIA